MASLVARRPVLAYAVLTFAISWGGVILAIGGTGALQTAPAEDRRFAIAVLAMIAGPSLSAVLLTALLEGPAGLRRLAARGLKWRVGRRWYAAALATAPVLWMATLVVLSRVSPGFESGVATAKDPAARVTVGLAAAVAAGVFEEIGWTGFAIPHLRRRRSAVATGLIVGALWGMWHLLTNVLWAVRLSAGDLPLSIFLPVSVAGLLVGYLTAFRVLMVWVYDRTGSLLVAMLMHVSLTACVLILDPVGLTGLSLLAYSAALAAAVWLAAGAVAGYRRILRARRENPGPATASLRH